MLASVLSATFAVLIRIKIPLTVIILLSACSGSDGSSSGVQNNDPRISYVFPEQGGTLSAADDINPNKAGIQINVLATTGNIADGTTLVLTNSLFVDASGTPLITTGQVQSDVLTINDYTIPQGLSVLQLALSSYDSQQPCDGGNCDKTALNPLAEYWDVDLPSSEVHPNLFYDASNRAEISARINQAPWNAWWPRAKAYDAINWWFTNNIAKAENARSDLINNPIYREPVHGYLEPSSHRFSNYIVAYDILAAWDGLSAEDHTVIRDKIVAEAAHYYNVLSGGEVGGANYGNQRTLAASALGLAALTLSKYETGNAIGPEQWLSLALHEIHREENFSYFLPNGLYMEGVGYSQYMAIQFIQFAIAYERATGKYILLDPRLQEWLRFVAYQTTGTGLNIPWGTSEAWDEGLGYLGLLANSRYGGELAPLFKTAFNQSDGPLIHWYQSHIGIALYDPDIPDTTLSATWSFPGSHTIVSRKNWGHQDGVSLWFAGKGDDWTNYHWLSHGDSGSFVLSAWDEILATDSGYDHWVSFDYYSANFHNVILIDGGGPLQDTAGELSHIDTQGIVRHARVTSNYQNSTIERTIATVRDRYVVVVDKITADVAHDYTWQIRSTSPPGSTGSELLTRSMTWPGLAVGSSWDGSVIGDTLLTTVVPDFSNLTVEIGRWRPLSAEIERNNQLALAKWNATNTTAMFVLIPNKSASPDVTWSALDGQNIRVTGPDWSDDLIVTSSQLTIETTTGTSDLADDVIPLTGN